MAGQDDALYAQAQHLFDTGDREGAQRIATQLQARGYRPQAAAPAPVQANPAVPTQASPAAPAVAPVPQRAPAPAPSNADVPDVIRNGGEQAISEYRNAQRFRAAGNRAQSDLAAARAMGYAHGAHMLNSATGGRYEAGVLSAVPEGVSNFFGRLMKPQGMSDAAFNEYSHALHSSLESSRPASSFGGVVAQSLAIPEVGAERLAASLGGRAVARVGARLAENAGVGAAVGAVNADSADQAAPGAVLGAVGGEAGRLAGHGISFLVRRVMPGRSTAAYRVVANALGDQQITPAELAAAETRFRTATGRAPSVLDILRDPALGDRGQRALTAIQGVARGDAQATAHLQTVEAEAARAARARTATNPHPETSRQSDITFGAIADNPVHVEDASALAEHQDIGQFIRPRAGEVGMVPSQTRRFRGAQLVTNTRQAVAEARTALQDTLDAERTLHGQPNVTQAQADAAADAVNRARTAVGERTTQLADVEARYHANPVTVNDLDALRQVLAEGVQKTGNTRIGTGLRQHISDVADNASGGQYSQNLAQHAAGAQAEEEALSRGVEATREATPGSSYQAGGVMSHAMAGGAHAINGSPTGALYHLQRALTGGNKVNPAEARDLARAVSTPAGAAQFSARLMQASDNRLGRSGVTDLLRDMRAFARGNLRGGAGTGGTTSNAVGAITRNLSTAGSNASNSQPDAPSNQQLYEQAQQLFDNGDTAGAQRIVDQLKASNFVPGQPENTAETTSMPITNDAAEALIRHREGFRAQAYNDVGGHPTIGYGHLIKDGESFPNGISEADAQTLMRRDIAETSAPLSDLSMQLSDEQKHALISFGYNAGPGALRRVVDAINSGGLRAGASIMSRYTTSNGKHVSALAARRQSEVRALLPSSGV